MKVARYSPNSREIWDQFISASKNGTFLLSRNYMDYHADRFTDHSLLFRNEKDRLVAVLPAHNEGDVLSSHGGLTYGGIVSDDAMTTPVMLDVFDSLLAYARAAGIARIRYKTIPTIYAKGFAEEDRYALFRHQGTIYRRDVLAVVDQSRRLEYQERRLRKIKQARSAELIIAKSNDYAGFWNILERNLQDRFGTSPVHTSAEMELLAHRFPDNIGLYVCCKGSEVLAGVVVYITPQVVHAQYISASDEGKTLGALDLLFAEILDTIHKGCRYFDFGISTEQNGQHLNVGLVEQKEGFGARAVMHDHYEIMVS